MPELLAVANISRSFSGVAVVRNVGFSIQGGQCLGLVGENGAGKSTLMNILGGVFPADAGRMRLDGGEYAPRNPRDAALCGIAFVHQELNLFPNLSVAENLFIPDFPARRLLGVPLLDRRIMIEKARGLLARVKLDVPPETLVESLSQAERQLVEIARSLHSDARVIIFDEPTTSLAARDAERLFGIIGELKSQGIAVVYISHALNDVMRLADRIVVLRDGEVVGAGPREEFTVERMISLMVGREMDQIYPVRQAAASAGVVLQAKQLRQPGIVDNINLTLRGGEVLGVYGLMGSGRSELARILFGLDPLDHGEVLLDGERIDRLSTQERIQRGLAFLTESRREDGLLRDATATANLGLVALPGFARTPMRLIETARLRAKTGEVAVAVRLQCADRNRQPLRHLSGGNQQKVALGKWLVNTPKALILDEPTRGIDVGAKFEIYNIINELARQGVGLLVISSELEELLGICDRILVMRKGEVIRDFARRQFDRENVLRAAFGEAGGE